MPTSIIRPMFGRTISYYQDIADAGLFHARFFSKKPLDKLKRLIKHAYEEVPFYNDLFRKNGIRPARINHIEDILDIPVITKKDLSDIEPDALLSRRADKNGCHVLRTSGETGKPFDFLLTTPELIIWKLLLLRFMRINRLALTDRCSIVAHPLRFPEKRRWFQTIGILRHDYISSLLKSSDILELLIRNKPDIIFGYPGALEPIADLIIENNDTHIRPKAVLTSGEILYDDVRYKIKRAFGTGASDLYSTVETGPVAWQCTEQNGYHINGDSIIIEFLNSRRERGSPGEELNIICTNLFCNTMPIIRYSVGDIAVYTEEPCRCRRNTPMIKRIEGRPDNFISLPDGRKISPAAMNSIFSSIISHAQHQVIQKDDKNITIRLAPSKYFKKEYLPLYSSKIRSELGEQSNIEFELVEKIEGRPSGKRPRILSGNTARSKGEKTG